MKKGASICCQKKKEMNKMDVEKEIENIKQILKNLDQRIDNLHDRNMKLLKAINLMARAMFLFAKTNF